MKSFLTIIFALLGLLLPLHGGITVFFPEIFRWWKEVLLLGILLASAQYEIRTYFLIKNKNFIQKIKSWTRSLKIPEKISIGILLVIFFLIILSDDIQTSAEAGRYLGLPFLVFFVVSRLSNLFSRRFPSIFDFFSHFFVLGCILSIAFGIWVQSGFGIDFVQNFYSNTISSWVPGQTLQIWHETNGLMRMQGLSSGPIEFSHLLLAGLALVPILRFKTITKALLYITLFSGIFLSYSRAAILGGIIIMIFQTLFSINQCHSCATRNLLISWIPASARRTKKARFIMIFLIILFSSFFLIKNTNFIQRIIHRTSTADHLTRPIESFKIGIKSPFLGNIGQLGPAARSKNLRENNSDKAPIAENVFIDYFAQLGLGGLFLFLWFWRSLYNRIQKKFLGFFWTTMALFLGATIFDMTPISITYLVLFAFFTHSDTNKKSL